MYTAFLLIIAAAGLAVAVRGLAAARRLDSKLVLFNVAALVAVALDSLLGGLGRWLGAGEQLRDVYALPLLISMVALPLTLYTFATICRRLGFAWARPDWGHGAVCLYAAALLLYSLRGVFALKQIHPAYWRDVVWYPTSTGITLVLASVLLAYLGLGAGLWWRDRRPWLFAAMGVGILLTLLPAVWGPVPWFVGESLCFSAMTVAAIRYAAS